MKPTNFLVILIVLIFSLLIPITVFAQGDSGGYVSIKGGMFTPTDDLEDFDSGFAGELAVGTYFSDKKGAFEVGIGHFSAEGTESGFDAVLGNWSEKVEVTTIPIYFTLRGNVQLSRGELFVGGGVGFYFIDYQDDFSSTASGPLSVSGNDNIFGAHITAGANLNISEKVFFGIDGKMIFTEDAKISDTVMGYPIEIEGNGNGYIISGVIGFRF